MKLILVFALFATTSALYAGSFDAITSILAIGTYRGVNSDGACTISVREVNFPKRAVMVTATDDHGEFSKLVEDREIYQRCYKSATGSISCANGKQFLLLDHANMNADGTSFVEKVLKTMPMGFKNEQLYVVVAERMVINRILSEDKVECTIAL